MDARGFGRRGPVSTARRRLVASAVVVGLLAVTVSVYELLDASSPAVVGLPLLVAGAVIACAAALLGRRDATRTRYRPDTWRSTESIVVGAGIAALASFVVAGWLQPGSLHTTTYPLAIPVLPWPALLGLLCALVPAWVTPPQFAATQGDSARVAPVGRTPHAVGAGR